ncbi:MAG: universal stress protein [Acidobacteria bacterium]|nr:universal stress protein [Acidobacteriota bacterium]
MALLRAVVAGVDLTAMGRRVADRSRVIAESAGVDLNLVHVLEPVGEAMIDPGLATLMREHQHAQAEKLAAWCRKRSSVVVNLDVVKGSPSWELASRAKGAELVVVGSSTIDAFTAGPVARRVARMARSDTLVVRRQPRVPYRRIIAAVDFSEASRVAVERSLTLFPEADVTVLYSLPSRFDLVLSDAGLFSEELEASRVSRLEAAADRMAEFVQPWSGNVRTLIADGPPTETIDEVVRRRNADLIVVANRGATATRMVLLGTVAEELVARSPCDVLVARCPSSFRRP